MRAMKGDYSQQRKSFRYVFVIFTNACFWSQIILERAMEIRVAATLISAEPHARLGRQNESMWFAPKQEAVFLATQTCLVQFCHLRATLSLRDFGAVFNRFLSFDVGR
jgi:hypothetical protein